MKTKDIPHEFLTHELTHRYFGNGIYFVRRLDTPNYCQCCTLSMKPPCPVTNVYTVHEDMLEKYQFQVKAKEGEDLINVDSPIKPEQMASITELREQLNSGTHRIHHWRAVPVEAAA